MINVKTDSEYPDLNSSKERTSSKKKYIYLKGKPVVTNNKFRGISFRERKPRGLFSIVNKM